jgi:hypothetical protein
MNAMLNPIPNLVQLDKIGPPGGRSNKYVPNTPSEVARNRLPSLQPQTDSWRLMIDCQWFSSSLLMRGMSRFTGEGFIAITRRVARSSNSAISVMIRACATVRSTAWRLLTGSMMGAFSLWALRSVGRSIPAVDSDEAYDDTEHATDGAPDERIQPQCEDQDPGENEDEDQENPAKPLVTTQTPPFTSLPAT